MRSWVPLGVVAAGLAVAPAAQASPSREAEYARLLATLSSAEPAEREELVRAQVLPDVISRLIVVDASLTRPDAAEAKLDALGPFDDAPMAVRIYVQGLRCTLAGHRGQAEEGSGACAAALGPEVDRERFDREHPFVAARTYYFNGIHAFRRGQVGAMLGFVNPALVLARELDSDFLKAAAHNARGVLFRMSALRHKAVEEYETALHLTTSSRSRHVLMHNLGELYLFNNQLEIARDTFEASLEWSEQNDEPHRAHVARMNLADTLMRLGDIDGAVEYLEVSLANEELGTGRGRAAVLLGEALAKRGDHEAALQRYDQSLELEPSHPDHRRRVGLRKVESLEALGRRDEARALLHEVAWEPSKDHPPEGLLLLQDLRRHAALWNQVGDSARAYAVERRATELQNRIEGRETTARLDILRVEAEAHKRRQDLAKARADEAELRRRVQLNHFSWGAALVGISILFLVGYLQSSRIHQRRLAQERQRQTERLEALVNLRTAELEREVEQRLRSQEERRKVERRLAESDRLRVLGQLTGGVAHDFNNLLTVMMSAAEFIREDATGSKDVKELAQSILRATESGQSITRDLLTYAGKQRLAPEVVRLDRHVTSIRTLLNHAVAKNAALNVKTDPVSARLDPGLLTTAILNLVRNAVEASAPGSTVFVEVKVGEGSNEAWVVVRDEGVGMTGEEIRQACEPFYTNKTTAVASGLGLSMVYGFVTQSGGRLHIDSAPGRGTEVRLAWPRWQPSNLVEDLRPEIEVFGKERPEPTSPADRC